MLQRTQVQVRLAAEAGAVVPRRRVRGGDVTGGSTTPPSSAARRVSGVLTDVPTLSAHDKIVIGRCAGKEGANGI